MKQKNSETAETGSSWGTIFSGFIGGFVRQWSEGMIAKIKSQIQIFIHQTQKSLVGIAILLIGVGFFLTGISLLINEMIRRPGSWIGYSAAGSLTVVVGYFIQRK